MSALAGNKAISMDLLEKQVVLEKGGSVKFEKLLIATGGKKK